MKAISFELGGKTAFFKKPDVNVYAYFTYNNIHKPVLLGLLGAILGLKGHNQLFNELTSLRTRFKNSKKEINKVSKAEKELLTLKEGLKSYNIDDKKYKSIVKRINNSEKKLLSLKDEFEYILNLEKELEYLENSYPEYYEKLNKLKISIIPLSENGYFTKKIQVFNNSVGYASKEQGGNLIVREQWLESPKWKIIILDDNSIEREIFDKLEDYLLNSKTVFIPYLGKNDHPAKIDKVEKVKLEKIEFNGKIDSLFINKNFLLNSFPPRNEIGFLFKEVSPIKLKEKYHFYEYETLAYTNYKMNINSDESLIIYSKDSKNYFFF